MSGLFYKVRKQFGASSYGDFCHGKHFCCHGQAVPVHPHSSLSEAPFSLSRIDGSGTLYLKNKPEAPFFPRHTLSSNCLLLLPCCQILKIKGQSCCLVTSDLLPPPRPPPTLLLLLLILITFEPTTPNNCILPGFSDSSLIQLFSGTFHSPVFHDTYLKCSYSSVIIPLLSPLLAPPFLC